MIHSQYNIKLDMRLLSRWLFVAFFGSIAILFIAFTITHGDPHDFGVFYSAAKAALHGEPIYGQYGQYHLPYWYFPWMAWFYIPLAVFPHNIAYTLYVIISLLCALVSINYLASRMIPDSSALENFFIFCMALVLCWLLFKVGQMDFLLLAIAVLTIHFIDREKPFLAGLLVPILLFKPHLFILFLPYALLKGGRRFFASATLAFLVVSAISFIAIPDWPLQMIRELGASGQRIDNTLDFITLPEMLGMQENWSGTANLPMTFALMVLAFALIWKFRQLPTLLLLSLALAGSLFSAPRAYTYNFPILFPAMIWVSSDLPKPFLLLFWLAAGIAAFVFGFSTGAYSIVLVVFLLGILKARKSLTNPMP